MDSVTETQETGVAHPHIRAHTHTHARAYADMPTYMHRHSRVHNNYVAENKDDGLMMIL